MRRHKPAPRWVSDLATYNSERARGIVHSPEWQERMARLQAHFDQQQRLDSPWVTDPLAAPPPPPPGPDPGRPQK